MIRFKSPEFTLVLKSYPKCKSQKKKKRKRDETIPIGMLVPTVLSCHAELTSCCVTV